ncbi:MAG: Fic family protein [Saccharofermentanales bacterium]|jgi:Fic family protein
MRTFNYSELKNQKWDTEVLALIAAIYKGAGKQEIYLKQRPEELEKLVEIAKIQSTEASNAIEGIVTTSARIRQLVEEKTTPGNRNEQAIAGYRDVLNIIHESFDTIPISRNYILQFHKILYSYMNNPMAGKIKNVQNYISATYPDGQAKTIFTPLAPYETPEVLDRICEEYNHVIGNMEVEPLMVRRASMNKIGRFTKQDIRELCPSLSISSTEGALRKLVASGELERGGVGRSTYYVRIN